MRRRADDEGLKRWALKQPHGTAARLGMILDRKKATSYGASARVVDCAEQAGAALIFEGGCAVSDRDIEVELLPEQIAAVRGLVEACDDLRELAQESDAVVEEDAAAAETAAREALEAVLAGDADAATSCAEEAAHRERRYGDAPTWGALRDAVQRWAELRATEEAA